MNVNGSINTFRREETTTHTPTTIIPAPQPNRTDSKISNLIEKILYVSAAIGLAVALAGAFSLMTPLTIAGGSLLALSALAFIVLNASQDETLFPKN